MADPGSDPDVGDRANRTEHGHGHGEPRVDDGVVAWRLFGAVGVLVAVIAAIYWFTAYEDAGTVLLVLTAVLGLWCGVFLWLQQRRLRAVASATPATTAGTREPAEEGYMPHASVWPFVIGLGAATAGNGLVLGTWVLVPGLFLTLLGVTGFVHQTRHRS
jgi:cytochrome c oxidase subunit IV